MGNLAKGSPLIKKLIFFVSYLTRAECHHVTHMVRREDMVGECHHVTHMTRIMEEADSVIRMVEGNYWRIACERRLSSLTVQYAGHS